MTHSSTERFLTAAHKLGLDLDITTFEQPTRTAEEAAEAVGCDVAQIIKSLCFLVNDRPTIALVSGKNRLDLKKLAAACGVGKKRVKRADADRVKQATGFSIGGVPPFGHVEQLDIFIDEDLTQFNTVWAAAGTPYSVFEIGSDELVKITDGIVIDLCVEAN